MSEYSKKMVLLQLEDYEEILRKALKLAKANAYDDNLKLNINNEIKSDCNIIDYVLNKPDLKYQKEFNNISKQESPELYTKISPNSIKFNKNKKFKLFPIK